jgi:hypothetical protein
MPSSFGLGPDVHASGRLLQDQHFQRQAEPSRDEDLLQGAARQRPGQIVEADVLEAQVRGLALHVTHLGGAAQERPADHLPRHHGVLQDAQVGERPFACAVARDETDPAEDGRPGRAGCPWPGADLRGPLIGGRDPQEGLDQRGRPQRCPGEAEDLARADRDVDPRFRMREPQRSRAAPLGAPPTDRHVLGGAPGRRLPEHRGHDLGVADAVERDGVDDGAAVPQDRRHVGDLPDLMHAVRHQHHADALVLEPAQHLEQPKRLLDREAGRRLVEQDELGPAAERAGDLDQLQLVQGQLTGDRSRIDVVESEHPQHPGALDGGVPPRKERTRSPQRHVLGDRQLRQDREFLVHDGDPAGAEGQLAEIGGCLLIEDRDEGRLARAIAAEQRVDLIPPERDVHVGEGPGRSV